VVNDAASVGFPFGFSPKISTPVENIVENGPGSRIVVILPSQRR
jgi:hypothetical protein